MNIFERKTYRRFSALRLAAAGLFVVLMTVAVGCASIGRPEGGARDVTPPVYVRSTPVPGERNVARQRVDVWFDENIQMDDAFNKVVVSPVQVQAPVIRSFGKHLFVELRDTLLPNTTYTIDFADAIKDLNEGNVLDGMALDFSTGPEIDSLRISGIVMSARDLEPAQGITVGVYREPADTTFDTTPFSRIARTNSLGQFTVRGLGPGRYAVYALNDLNRDNRYDRSEDVAFLSTLVVPEAVAITVNDTLRTAADVDSIVARPGVAYLPDDVLLTWFNADYRPQYVKDYSRPERRKVVLNMAAPCDSLPRLTVAGGALDGADVTDMSALQRNITGDSLTYWLTDPALLAVDSLTLAVKHRQTDSLSNIVWQTDTLKFFWKEPKKKKENKKADGDTVASVPSLAMRILTGPSHDVYRPLHLAVETPVATIDTAGIRLETTADSVWRAVKGVVVRPDSIKPLLDRQIDFARVPAMKYRLTIDSAAVTDVYGLANRPLKHEFTVRKLEEYSSLTFTLQNADTTAIVELLNDADKPVRTQRARDGAVTFRHLNPGTYYARLYLDADGNGQWSTGNVGEKIQPEEVYYYPHKLELRANWDVEQSWDIFGEPLDRQKPNAIKKNKPVRRHGEDNADDNDDVEYDEWGEPVDRRPGNNRRPGNTPQNPLGGLGGGRQQAGGTTGTLRR